jgi:DNA-binding winged helix-turn-helix (wHTH) protein/Flp pilus assembly protein TadD
MATPLAYEFGGFRFEPGEDRLSCGEYAVHLTPKAAQTLLALLKRPDAVVSKEELFEAVWPGVAVEENNLNQQISALRRALSYEGHIVTIETVPRRGYRLIGPVRVVDPLAAPSPPPISEPAAHPKHSPPSEGPAVTPAAREGSSGWLTSPMARIAATVAMIAMAFGAWNGWRWYQRREVVRKASSALERGENLLRARNAAGAVRELEEAARNDPNNARIYGALAHALAASATSQPSSAPRPAGQSPAVQAAERGVALDPTCGDCHGTLGLFLFYHDWEWARAEKHLGEAMRLAPDDEGIRPAYAMYLMATGHQSEALKQINIALDKRPHQLTWLGIRASILYDDRQYAEAIAAADQALLVDNHSRGAWDFRSKSLFQLGRGPEAIHALVQDLFPEHRFERKGSKAASASCSRSPTTGGDASNRVGGVPPGARCSTTPRAPCGSSRPLFGRGD